MYRNDEYMTIHDSVIAIKQKWPDKNIINPFPSDFTIFNSIDDVRTYGFVPNNLWSVFSQWFARLAISKKVPRIGYVYAYRDEVITIADRGDQAEYVWRYLCDAVGWYCAANKNRWTHIILADTAQYDPITNYRMEETSGTTSKVSGTKSYLGTQTTKSQVYPYDSNDATIDGKPDSKTSVSQAEGDAGHSGYEADDKTLTWDDITTPTGNATSVNKLLRSGNIGVTTSQQMIQSEYDLRKFNVLQEFMNEVAKYSLILDWDSALNDTY